MNLGEVSVGVGRALPCIDLEGACFVTAPITLPGHAEGRLRVGATKDCVLVIQAAKKVRAAYGDRHILLVAIVAAKHRLNVEPCTLTGVVFLGGELKAANELDGNERGITPGT